MDCTSNRAQRRRPRRKVRQNPNDSKLDCPDETLDSAPGECFLSTLSPRHHSISPRTNISDRQGNPDFALGFEGFVPARVAEHDRPRPCQLIVNTLCYLSSMFHHSTTTWPITGQTPTPTPPPRSVARHLHARRLSAPTPIS